MGKRQSGKQESSKKENLNNKTMKPITIRVRENRGNSCGCNTPLAKKDACYNKVASRYKGGNSAYRSGAMVKCRKVGAANWGNSSK